MNHEEREMYDFACKLIQAAGLKLRRVRQHPVIEVKAKTSQMDLVSEHDLLIEKFMAEAILEKYPGHEILAEESGAMGGNIGASCIKGTEPNVNCHMHTYLWVIDPIDGTLNYYRFGKDYAISVALHKGGSPVFGLVYDVAGDVMFSGLHGEGAFKNGCRLSAIPDRQRNLDKAVVAVSLRTMIELTCLGMDVLGMLSRAQAYRYVGCASLEMCMVANGKYDLFISTNVYHWDVAAAGIFLEQRGGIFLCRKKDNNRFRVGKLMVAAFRSPLIWEEALEYLPKSIKEVFE